MGKSNKSETKNKQKSGAERAEYRLLIDVRQFMQQIQGFINGLQRDEKTYHDQIAQKEEEKKPEKKSSIIVNIKKKKNKSLAQHTPYTVDNLLCWKILVTSCSNF